MKLTNFQMDNYIALLGSLKEEHELGWAIAKNIHILSDAAKEYIDMKQKLVEEHGKMIDGRKTIDKETNPEGFKAYIDAMGNIPNIEQDVNVYQIGRDVFCSGGLTSPQMAALMWMVKEDE